MADQVFAGFGDARRLRRGEVVIPPRSPLVDADVFPGMVTNGGALVVLGVLDAGLAYRAVDWTTVVLLGAMIAVFGQLIGNTATALIVVPIAVSAAGDIGVSGGPVPMSVAVAAAVAFLTPVATPANGARRPSLRRLLEVRTVPARAVLRRGDVPLAAVRRPS